MSKITIPENSILLLEGGSLRGLYTAGVLDTFMENGLYFPAVAGVSAGALNALNYVSHQPGRAASINLRYRHDPRYFGPKAALRRASRWGPQARHSMSSTSTPPQASRARQQAA